jgi:RNA polymerase sigma-70 factor (ECF subfamily)
MIAACRAGDAEAFGELVTRYQDRAYSLAYRLTGNADDAAETVQEAFLKAYRGLDSFRGDAAFYTWLFRIVVNEVKSRRRSRRARPVTLSLDARPDRAEDDPESPVSGGLRANVSDPSDEATRAENRRLVEAGIAKLDEEERMMIVLRDIEGRNYDEIADLLGCPKGTVKSRLHRARMTLKDHLAPVFGQAV